MDIASDEPREIRYQPRSGKKIYVKQSSNNQHAYGIGFVCVDSYGWPGWLQLLYGNLLRLSKQGCTLIISVLFYLLYLRTTSYLQRNVSIVATR